MYDLLKMLMRPLHATFDRRSMSHATAQILGQTKLSPKAAGLGGWGSAGGGGEKTGIPLRLYVGWRYS